MDGFDDDEFFGNQQQSNGNDHQVTSETYSSAKDQQGFQKNRQLDEDLFDVFEDDQDEDYLKRTTVNTKKEMEKAGYRAGAIKAEEETSQKGFDDGFEVGMKVGKFVGEFLAKLVQYPTTDGALKTVLYKLLASLVREGSQKQFSEEYFKSIEPTISTLPGDLQESFQSFRLSLQSLLDRQ